MKPLCALFLFLSLVSLKDAAAQDTNAGLLSLQTRLREIYEQNQSCVVTVYASHAPAEQGGRASNFVGTGFFISLEGHVLTNSNIVHGADRIWIEYEGIGYLAELVGADPVTNVAVIRTPAVPAKLSFLRFPAESVLPRPSTLLVAITSELGMPPGPSLGLVKGLNTRYGERVLPSVYLRTDIALDGGEGGSPVFDLNGVFIGMAIVALPEIRSSFILPAKAVERIRDDILFSGSVQFAHFGLTTLEIRDTLAGRKVVVSAVEPDGPAAQAGILPKDGLVKIGNTVIKSDDDVRVAFFFARPEERIVFEVLRDSAPTVIEVKPGVRRTPPSAVPVLKESLSAARDAPSVP